MNIRVMSSNVWGNTAADHIVANRCDNLKMIFERYKPCVLGCQEFSPRMRDIDHNLAKLIENTYCEVPETPENKYNNNYTPIFYNPDIVALGDHGYFYFSGLNDIGSKSASWAVFTIKESGKDFLMINTHYYWTNDDPGREARINNTKELLALYKTINSDNLPTVVTGDFNCISKEKPIEELIENGFYEARFISTEPVVNLRSYHDYPKLNLTDPNNPFWENGEMPNERIDESIDHIFTKGEIKVNRYITVTDKEALNSSDHCPIFVDISL